MGFDIGPLRLIAVENTEQVHNVIVCTLCSCYPRNLLGLPPDWYKSRAYRSRTVKEPRKVLSEFGLTLPAETTVRVHDSTADMRYIVLPARPKGTEGWDQDRLAGFVTRDSMVGTGLPRTPT
jgi:nitrile hydratase